MMTQLGTQLIHIWRQVLTFSKFFFGSILAIFAPPFRFKEFFKQLYFIANGSLAIVLICVSFAAVVTILESAFHMRLVISDHSMVPGFAAMLIFRELGAVVTALLLTSRVGAGVTAEVGSMQITEQVDALRMLGIDPTQFLVVPRLLACILGAFILTLIANLVCLYCAFLVSQWSLGFTFGMFKMAVVRFVDFSDLLLSGFKGAVFGAVIPLIGCYYGFRCQNGAEGVGLATTNSVVASSVVIIFLDFILTFLLSGFY